MTTSINLSSIKDNHKHGSVGQFLIDNLKSQADLSVVSAYFTIYAYNADAARKRLEILKVFSHLELNHAVEKMAQVYVEKLKIPPKALRDAVHLAVASVHSVDYLVTWNCAHIANGEVIKKLMQINSSFGITTPVICTPEELMPTMKGE